MSGDNNFNIDDYYADEASQVDIGGLSDEFLDELKEAFALVDKDGDGYITSEEFTEMIRSLGQNPTEAELYLMIMELFPHGAKNHIDFDGFVQYFAQRLKDVDDEEELREAFRVFDKEETGLINVAELRHYLVNTGEKLTTEECDVLIKEDDLHIIDGMICYEDLIQTIMSK